MPIFLIRTEFETMFLQQWINWYNLFNDEKQHIFYLDIDCDNEIKNKLVIIY